MKTVLEDPRIKKVGQNLKFDMVVLRNHGIRLQGLYFDTLVAHYLLQPGVRNHKLDTFTSTLTTNQSPLRNFVAKARNKSRSTRPHSIK